MGDINAVCDGHDFDSSQVEPSTPFEPVPAGWYPVMIAEIEVKQTKAGTGYYLKLTHQIVDGEFSGRKLWDQINLKNPSPKAEEIGLRQFSALCRAAGVMTVKDSSQLKEKLLMAKAKVTVDEQYGPKNEVIGYKSLEGVAPAAAAPAQSPPAQAPVAPPVVQQQPPVTSAAAKPPTSSAAPSKAFVPPWKR